MTPNEIQVILYRLGKQDEQLEIIAQKIDSFSAWKYRVQGAIALIVAVLVPIAVVVLDHHPL